MSQQSGWPRHLLEKGFITGCGMVRVLWDDPSQSEVNVSGSWTHFVGAMRGRRERANLNSYLIRLTLVGIDL
jgi:hypothetical protein